LESCTPLNERLARIATIRFRQIEAIDARRHMLPVQQGKEVGLTVVTCGIQLPVDDAGFRREAIEARGRRRLMRSREATQRTKLLKTERVSNPAAAALDIVVRFAQLP